MERIRAYLFVLALAILCCVAPVRSSASDHRYKAGDEVPLYANKVAPVKEKKEALGEVLNGDRLVSAPYKIDFLSEKDAEIACKKKLTKEEVAKFRTAVSQDYYFQMYYDDLRSGASLAKLIRKARPIRATTSIIFKHLVFEILYNKDRVIEINVQSDPNAVVDLTGDEAIDVDFVYTVKWKERETPLRNGWRSTRCHLPCHTTWRSTDEEEETGGSTFMGMSSGIQSLSLYWQQLLVLARSSLLLQFSFLSLLYLFLLSTRRNKLGEKLITDGKLFCGPLFVSFCFLNTVAIAYKATAALPFGTIVVIFLIWALVTSPLLVLGGVAGKNNKAEFQAPCRAAKYPREIPPLPWYRKTLPQMAMAGFLPFSAIYIELYYIFASVWGHRIYTIYNILFIVFIILLIVTAFITVALTYFQLAAEDHEWWWRSFLCGGSTGLFIYAYCLYYYNARSDMSGFMQTSFFGYMACVCYGFFLMLGTIGFRASLFFVRHIYRSIKCE
ncbi:Transmembrane 9 superfamily member 2 [Hibiscus syriacus]|uniref:Transmembrane 9 superfamily member n=1 Tax=Hibiscus syriacus TaxID=106335 RepID=A0A6A2X9C4_HIBSY|nr:Transmembrane 9 superfamily member 2 [Hibiscus syriacus]